MKRILFILSLLAIQSIISLSAQDNFANIGSIWHNTIPDPVNGSPFYDFTKYECIKDTVIDTLNCKFISSSKVNPVIIYEENDKVYFLNNGKLNLLFDFAVEVGDTIYFDMQVYTFLIENETDFIFIDTIMKVLSVIEDVDSILFESVYLKQIRAAIYPAGDFLVNAVWPRTFDFTQKLGCVQDGLIPLLIKGMGPAIENSKYLRCYSDSEISYLNPHWEQYNRPCNYRYNTSINNMEKSMIDVNIYPNPTSERINIDFRNFHGECRVFIYGIAGTVYQRSFAFSGDDTIITLSLKGWYPGVYYIAIRSKEGELLLNQTFIKK